MTELITFGRPFVLRRDRDISDVSGTGIIADGALFPDGHAVIHWRGRWPLTTPHPDGMDSIIAIHDHGGQGDLQVLWADYDEVRRNALADIVEAFDVPAEMGGPEAERAYLRRQILRAVTAAWEAAQASHGEAERARADLADAVMPVVNQILEQRDRWRNAVGRAYRLAHRWEGAHGSSMFLVRAAGAELRDELDGEAQSCGDGCAEGHTYAGQCEQEPEPVDPAQPGVPRCTATWETQHHGTAKCWRRAAHNQREGYETHLGETEQGYRYQWIGTEPGATPHRETGPTVTAEHSCTSRCEDVPGIRGLLEHVGIDTSGRDITVAGRVVDPADQGPPNQGPLTGIEVRDPCPYCEGSPALIPRTLMADHVRERHPEVREGGPGIPVPAAEPDPEPVTVTDPEWLRQQYAKAITAEHYRRAEKQIVASPEEHGAAMSEVVMRVRDRHLEQLRQRLELADADLRDFTESESADAAAGSYAHRAEQAEAALKAVREQCQDWADQPPSSVPAEAVAGAARVLLDQIQHHTKEPTS